MVVKPEDEMEKSSHHLLQCYFVCECKERQKKTDRQNGCPLDIYSYGQSMTPAAAGQTKNNKRKSMKDVLDTENQKEKGAKEN